MVNGQKIRELREVQRLSQLQLANACGVTQTMISKIEIGESDGTVTTLKKIANILGVTTDELLKEE